MKVRGFLLLAVIGAWVGLRLLAYASPPDPSWIAGLYDDADFDSVVVSITSASNVVESHPPFVPRPTWFVFPSVPQTDERPAETGAVSSVLTRAPPAS